MISDKFIFLAAVIGLSGSGSYSLNVLRGKTQPNRVSFFLWFSIPMIAFAAQIDEGVGLESIMTLVSGIGPLMIFVSSFLNKKSYWKISKLDIACAALSVVAIVFWVSTGNGITAIVLSIAADFLAGIPTIYKAFRYPETEHTSVFRNGIFNAGITLLIIDQWEIANFGFAAYVFAICLVLYLMIKFKLGKLIYK